MFNNVNNEIQEISNLKNFLLNMKYYNTSHLRLILAQR